MCKSMQIPCVFTRPIWLLFSTLQDTAPGAAVTEMVAKTSAATKERMRIGKA